MGLPSGPPCCARAMMPFASTVKGGLVTQGRGLEIRAGVDRAYSDVLTPEAVAALLALRSLDARRVELMRVRLERRRRRQERKQRIEFLPADGRLAGTDLTVADARAGRFAGSEIPPDLQRQWIQGTGPAAKPLRPGGEEHPQRRLRAAVGRGRLDVRRRGRARPGVDDVARQPAEPEACDRPRPALPAGRRTGRRRDERLGAAVLRPADRRGLAAAAGLHHADLPCPRPAPRRPPRAPRWGRRLLGIDRRQRALRGEQPQGLAGRRRLRRPLSPQDPDGRGSGALERDPDRNSRRTSRSHTARSRSTSSSSRSRPRSS